MSILDRYGPDIATLPGGERLPDDTDWLRDWPFLAAHAVAAVKRRKEAYPDLVASERMTAEDADQDVAAWEAIAAEWHWICTGEGEPPARDTLDARLAAVDTAIERAEAALRHNSRSENVLAQLDMNIAIRWHLSRWRLGDQVIHQTACLNHQLRADRQARRANAA